jgi:tripartite-type tricarboxylate transporter receptor subunit TctC
MAYGSAGRGTTHHLVGELLALKTGVKLTHVAYKGGGQAVADAAAGQVPLLVTVIPTAAAFMKEGRLKPIGITSRERSPTLPEVPTLMEQGVRDFDVMSWYGIFAPAKTPAGIVDRLQKELAAVLADPEIRAVYARAGFQPVGNTPAEFDRQYKADYKRWAQVVKEANIQVD